MTLSLELPDDLVEALAERAAEIVRGDRRFLSKEALAEYLGVSERTIKTWRAQGIPAYGGRPLMFDVQEVERWLTRRSRTPRTSPNYTRSRGSSSSPAAVPNV